MLDAGDCPRRSVLERGGEGSLGQRCMRDLLEAQEEQRALLCSEEGCSRRGIRRDCGLLVIRSRVRWGKCG